MVDIKIIFHENDRKVSAMVKALAFEIDGPKSVEGASKDFLERNGHLVFHFRSNEKAQEFRDAVTFYLSGFLARVLSA